MAEESIAADYWKESDERHALMNGTREQRLEWQSRSFPVEEALSTRIDEDDATLVDDLVAIAEAAPDDDALALFAAGTLWELVYNAGDRHVDRLETSARRHPAFLQALRYAIADWDGIGPESKKRLRPLLEG